MKKWICRILCICLLASSLSGCSEKTTPAEDFECEMIDGEVIITKYIGNDLRIYIPSQINDRPVTVIGEEAFAEYDMTHITVPDTVAKIESYAFRDCTCLVSVTFSKNLKVIGDCAFYGCKSLESVKLPGALECIDKAAFELSGLEQVALPDELQFLGEDAFARCENLASIKVPDNTKIEIGLNTENAGQVGYVTFFVSPVGSSFTTTYYEGAAIGSDEFTQLPTVLVVSADSYAHEQVKKYEEGYGLQVEVLAGSKDENKADKAECPDLSNPSEKKEIFYLLTECIQKNNVGEILLRSTYNYDDRGLVISYQSDQPEGINIWNEPLGAYVYQQMPCDGEVDLCRSFEYDQYGNPISVSGSGYGEWVNEYTYDEGRLKSYILNSGMATNVVLEYGADGIIKQWEKKQSREEEPLRIIETHKEKEEYIDRITYKDRDRKYTSHFEYDNAGNLTRFYCTRGSMEPWGNAVCTYDNNGRVTSESGFRTSASDQITYRYQNDILIAVNDERLEYSEETNGKIKVEYKAFQLTYVPLELTLEEMEMSRYRWNQFCGGFIGEHNYPRGMEGIKYPAFDLDTVLLLPREIYI